MLERFTPFFVQPGVMVSGVVRNEVATAIHQTHAFDYIEGGQKGAY
jgi:hypothetical protein